MDAPDWYLEWVRAYAVAWMLPADWVDAAGLWWPTFASLGATAAEMAEAGFEVRAADDPPKAWDKHLPAVKAALGRVRNREATAAWRRRMAAEDRGECVLCGNSGWVVVPHPKHVRAGEWVPTHQHERTGEPVYVTAAVTCSCWEGRRGADSLAARKNPAMTLEHYQERVCGRWRDVLAAVERVRAYRSRVEAAAQPADPGRLVAALAAGTRLRE